MGMPWDANAAGPVTAAGYVVCGKRKSGTSLRSYYWDLCVYTRMCESFLPVTCREMFWQSKRHPISDADMLTPLHLFMLPR